MTRWNLYKDKWDYKIQKKKYNFQVFSVKNSASAAKFKFLHLNSNKKFDYVCLCGNFKTNNKFMLVRHLYIKKFCLPKQWLCGGFDYTCPSCGVFQTESKWNLIRHFFSKKRCMGCNSIPAESVVKSE